jgi:hypothetical protein
MKNWLLLPLLFLSFISFGQISEANELARKHNARIADALDVMRAFPAVGTNAYTISVATGTLPYVPYAGPATYAPGDVWRITIGVANTSTSCSLTVNSEAAIPLKDPGGNNFGVGSLIAGATYVFVYNGTYFTQLGGDGSAIEVIPEGTVTASNGITLAGGNMELGGELTEITSVTFNDVNHLEIYGEGATEWTNASFRETAIALNAEKLDGTTTAEVRVEKDEITTQVATNSGDNSTITQTPVSIETYITDGSELLLTREYTNINTDSLALSTNMITVNPTGSSTWLYVPENKTFGIHSETTAGGYTDFYVVDNQIENIVESNDGLFLGEATIAPGYTIVLAAGTDGQSYVETVDNAVVIKSDGGTPETTVTVTPTTVTVAPPVGGFIIFTTLPTSCSGAPSGALWNDSNTIKICP